MSLKNQLLAACMFAAFASPALADDIIVNTQPPELREETTPPPREGYLWTRGYWAWENGEHVWHEGRWIEVTNPQAQWIPDHWDKQDDTHWRFVPGHWQQG